VNAAFAPTTDIIVTGGIDGNAYIWDLGNRILPRKLGTALTDNLDAITHIRFSSDGNTLATAGSRGDVVLRDMRPTYDLRGRLDETACLVTAGGLNRDQWARYLPDLEYRDTCGG
jgi:WD40 repeat protein